ncbi:MULTISPECIES: pentapeptide repeat-containing protein [unclassified Paraburkholderia]|uniref:pentapeptide repeat-containing protein n=1 Tax=unclassified Paraburkholderia TaxID=2615204 RepID=UPI002AB1778F|nr:MULTISPECIES: pentapeptide repeat-containing protein [unclassified Paraburkholderia]
MGRATVNNPTKIRALVRPRAGTIKSSPPKIEWQVGISCAQPGCWVLITPRRQPYFDQVEGTRVDTMLRAPRNEESAPMRSNPQEPSTSDTPHFSEITLDRDDLGRILRECGDEPTFEQCTFSGEDFSNFDFRAARFTRCNFENTLLEHAELARSRWLACKCASASFRFANLTEARFVQSDLNNTDWKASKLASAVFTGVKLTGARFVDARTLGLSFHDSLLIGADLRGLSFRKQALEGLNFSDADLSDCDFRDAVFEGGSLRNALLRNSRFDGADLRSVDLSGLRLADVMQHLKGTILSVEQAVTLIGDCGVRVQ